MSDNVLNYLRLIYASVSLVEEHEEVSLEGVKNAILEIVGVSNTEGCNKSSDNQCEEEERLEESDEEKQEESLAEEAIF